jgi:hypothetical protein
MPAGPEQQVDDSDFLLGRVEVPEGRGRAGRRALPREPLRNDRLQFDDGVRSAVDVAIVVP